MTQEDKQKLKQHLHNLIEQHVENGVAISYLVGFKDSHLCMITVFGQKEQEMVAQFQEIANCLSGGGSLEKQEIKTNIDRKNIN